MGLGTDSYRVLELDKDGIPVFYAGPDYNGFARLWKCSDCNTIQEAIEDGPDYWCCACSSEEQTMYPFEFVDTVFPMSDRIHNDPRDFRMKYMFEMFLGRHFQSHAAYSDFLSHLMGREVTLGERETAHRVISWLQSNVGNSDLTSVMQRIKSEETRRGEERDKRLKNESRLSELKKEQNEIEAELAG